MTSQDVYAFLGMYDRPALRPANEAWWAGLARHFAAHGVSGVPEHLDHSGIDPYDIWQSPGLFMAQTCGYPLTHRLADKVQLLGTPCYHAPGCDGADYRSLIIMRTGEAAENLAGALPGRIAVNGLDSYSGWRALVAMAPDIRSICDIVISGGHAASIQMVRDGAADLAAIDGVTFALIGDVEPEQLAGLSVVDQSVEAPGLPYVTRADVGEDRVRPMIAAIEAAFADPTLAQVRQSLRLVGFANVPLADYHRCMGDR